MTYKFACLNSISPIGLKNFTNKYEQVSDLSEANGILVRSASLHDMEFPESLYAIARAGAGVNNIPLQRCAEKGIVVFNTPGANANGVKELVFAGMLLAARDIVGGVDWVRANCGNKDISKIAEKEKKKYAGTELQGKKLGIIGLGAIGVIVANAAVSLGMDVYGYDPYVSVDSAWHLSRKITHVLNVDDIYKNCDFITIHVPLLDSTRHMIDKEAVIESGRVRCYVSDFPNSTVAGKKGCITTPHLGASTEESEINCAKMAVDELKDYLENGNIRNSVNYPSCDMGVCMTGGRVGIFHKNQPSMITQFTQILGASDVNIAGMSNKSKKEVAYTLIDFDSPADKELVKKLAAVKDVYRVRVIK